MTFMPNHTDMTNDVSAKRGSDIENWSTSDLGIVMLMMIAVIVVIQYNFFLNWIQFIGRNIIIVPAIIGLMLRFNFSTLKIGDAVKNFVVKNQMIIFPV